MNQTVLASPSSIEAKMNQIRSLIARMQKDEGSLDESLNLYKEASVLIAECQGMLDLASKSLTIENESQT